MAKIVKPPHVAEWWLNVTVQCPKCLCEFTTEAGDTFKKRTLHNPMTILSWEARDTSCPNCKARVTIEHPAGPS